MAKLLREFYKIVEVLVGDSKLGAKAPRWVNINSRSIGLPAPVSYTHLTLPTNREV